jgi:hypothetical protein
MFSALLARSYKPQYTKEVPDRINAQVQLMIGDTDDLRVWKEHNRSNYDRRTKTKDGSSLKSKSRRSHMRYQEWEQHVVERLQKNTQMTLFEIFTTTLRDCQILINFEVSATLLM